MHIIKSIAFAAATVCASQAYALDPATMNAAGTLKVYVGGASALSAAIGGLFTQNCNAATRTDYTYPTSTSFGKIFTCTLNATNDFGVGAIDVMFQKRDAGGSGIGVYPVANNTAIDFIDPSTCTGPASGTGTCTTLFQRAADGGVSDVEPAMFAASANTPPEFVGTSIGSNYTSVPINSTIFGLAVSNALYLKLQADQGTAGRPTVSQAAVGQMLRSGFAYDTIAWKLLLPNTVDGTENSQVTICRRVNGSGTQASANRFWLEYPFNSGVSMEPAVGGDSSVSAHGTTAASLYVVENSATADSRNCMTAANTAGGFAIGHISLENAETAAWKFVKIGGQEPSRDEAKAGRYAYFFESTGQTSTLAPANVQSFLNSFFAGAGLPSNLAQLSAPVQNGVMANPTVCPDPFGSGTPNEIAFCSRVTREGNSAKFPAFYR
ncbi:MAG: hypothetical protein ACSLE9_13260 [Burkholderiaceae bacterium]